VADAARVLPKFTQTTASATFRHGPFGGRTIGEVAGDLRSGNISPNQLPVDVIQRGENLLGLNTRSMLALRRAGISPVKLDDRESNRTRCVRGTAR
jgi:hypothetical protein